MATYQSQYTGQQIDAAVAFGMSPDATPTQNSTKGVTSGGVYAETSALKSALDDITGNELITFTSGAYIKTNIDTVDINSPVSDPAFKYAVIPCSDGAKFTINGHGGSVARTYAFIDDSGNVLEVAATSLIADDLIITAPENTAYLVLNDVTAESNRSYYGVLVKKAFSEYIPLDGDGLVQTKNIYGMEETDGTAPGPNIFNRASLLWDGYYVGVNAGQIYRIANANYKTYKIPVDGVSSYKFTNAQFSVVVKSDGITAIGGLNTNVNPVPSSGGTYIVWSFNFSSYPVSTYTVSQILTVYKIPANWDIEKTKKTPIGTASGTLSDGEYLEIAGRSALKDGESIVFKGYFSAFNTLRLAFMYAGGVSNYIDVGTTNVTVKNNSSPAASTAHGLTISHEITILFEIIRGDAKITIISNGGLWTTTVSWVQISGVASSPRVISIGTTCNYAELRTIYTATDREIWYFGDSYISFNDSSKWVYYLKEYGYDVNLLLSGSSGCSSAITRTAQETLLKYGTPKMCVMATGMNDGSDNGATPASIWSTNRDYFIANCEAEGIEPIFCTVPTVPSVNNEAKNAWVKASGYRYIDFAKAVGAQSDGSWYDGMLASDNVHPTVAGAKALFSQVLIDLPDVMLN